MIMNTPKLCINNVLLTIGLLISGTILISYIDVFNKYQNYSFNQAILETAQKYENRPAKIIDTIGSNLVVSVDLGYKNHVITIKNQGGRIYSIGTTGILTIDILDDLYVVKHHNYRDFLYFKELNLDAQMP